MSAIACAKMVCCTSYQDVPTATPARNESAFNVPVASKPSVSVVCDPLREAEQAVTIEHESVIVDVVAVVAPDGVKIEYDVSQADAA